jgi:UDP-N-acetylmuramate dehydrogenase
MKQSLNQNHNSLQKQDLYIIENEPLHTKNWFRTGGCARFFTEPISGQQFCQALEFATQSQQNVFLLGQGANLLFSDEGFDGLVIRPQLNYIEIIEQSPTQTLLKAGAGVSIDALIDFCLENQVIGLEEFSGIPGTVGGAVYINLHYFEFLLSQFLVSGTIVEKESGKMLTVANEWFNFGYNQSKLIEGKHYLVDATFALKSVSSSEIYYARGRRREIIRHRQKKYPTQGTCGSFFRNFFPHEITLENQGQKVIWIAYYLDKIGVKGSLSVGDAIVSHQHANMIVNRGCATSTDIINLARLMQQKVYQSFGILPQPECRLVGFKQYPLL